MNPYLVKGWHGGLIRIISIPLSFISFAEKDLIFLCNNFVLGKLCWYTLLAMVLMSTATFTSPGIPLSEILIINGWKHVLISEKVSVSICLVNFSILNYFCIYTSVHYFWGPNIICNFVTPVVMNIFVSWCMRNHKHSGRNNYT